MASWDRADRVAVADRRASERWSGVNRRASQRYVAFGTSIVVGWWDGPNFVTTEAVLQDISLTGAAALVRISLTVGRALVVRLSGAPSSEWIDAEVVGGRRPDSTRRHPALIRMRFRQTCPYAFFTRAISGIHRRRPSPCALGGMRPRLHMQATAKGPIAVPAPRLRFSPAPPLKGHRGPR